MKKYLLLLALTSCVTTDEAVSSARRFATDLGYEVRGVSCSGRDSDGDGYMSCSVRVIGDGPPLELQCGVSGCKQVQSVKVRTGMAVP